MPLPIFILKTRFYSFGCLVAASLLWALPATAQAPASQSPVLRHPPSVFHTKPAPPSVSNPKAGKASKAQTIKLYPTSAQETADAILADSLRQIYEKADDHFHEGEYNHAININRIVVQGDPHNVEAYGTAALLLWSTDRNDQAIAFLQQGIQANPDTYYLYDEMGAHYWLHLRDASTAIPYYEKAVKFKCPWATWHSLALCYEKTEQWDKSVSAWEGATRYPDDKLAPIRLERAKQERDKHKG